MSSSSSSSSSSSLRQRHTAGAKASAVLGLNDDLNNNNDDNSKSLRSSSTISFPLLCLLVLLPLRLLGSYLMPILDCDETYNYWEPLHHLMYGKGLQTWEYSPVYGLRSYLYLWLTSPIAWILKWVSEHFGTNVNGQPQNEMNKLILFYAIRASFGVVSAVIETRLLTTLSTRVNLSFARWCLLFFALSTGMFHATISYLPQTFTMFSVMLTLNAWLKGEYKYAIFYTGVAALVGWPFSVLISIPLALEVAWQYRRGLDILKPISWSLVTAAICILPTLVVDYYYYHRIFYAIWNIAMYNSNAQAEHGANLFGREPASFYFINLFLNFNIGSVLAYAAPIMLLLGKAAINPRRSLDLSFLRYLLPFYIWFGIFLSMPHKEERFLFVVYPYICICAGTCAYCVSEVLKGSETSSCRPLRKGLHTLFSTTIFLIFTLLSISRATSLYLNYHAPLEVWSALNTRAWDSVKQQAILPYPLPEPILTVTETTKIVGHNSKVTTKQTHEQRTLNICVGKEWYRYPTSFFVPSNVTLPAVTTASSSSSAASSSSSSSNGQSSHSSASAYKAITISSLEFRMRFIENDFRGLLPKHFIEAGSVEYREAMEKKGVFSSALHDLLSPYTSHTSTRPGTYLIPSGMNGDNRHDDSGRFLHSLDQCHYVVDLELENQKEQKWSEEKVMLTENHFTKDSQCISGYSWQSVYSAPFLDVNATPEQAASTTTPAWLLRVYRAFYVPIHSAANNHMRPYQLYQRRTIPC